MNREYNYFIIGLYLRVEGVEYLTDIFDKEYYDDISFDESICMREQLIAEKVIENEQG